MNQPNTASIRQTDADGNETLVEVGPFGINATIQHPAVVAFSTAMYEWFRTSGGQNDVEVRCQVDDPEKGTQMFYITMQRVGGLTPTEKLATAEARVRELEAQLAAAQDTINEANEQTRLADEAHRATRAQLAAAREDSARLDWMIEQSNNGEGWLSDDVWDLSYDDGDSDDYALLIRAAIDAARGAKPHRIIGGACIDCGKPLAEKCIPFVEVKP